MAVDCAVLERRVYLLPILSCLRGRKGSATIAKGDSAQGTGVRGQIIALQH